MKILTLVGMDGGLQISEKGVGAPLKACGQMYVLC